MLGSISQHGLCPALGISEENKVRPCSAQGEKDIGQAVDFLALVLLCTGDKIRYDGHNEIAQRKRPVHTGDINYLPYMILPLYTVIMKIDKRLVEAALDLGCTPKQVFTKVILPLSGPGILSGLTMVFVPAVSTFYISQKLGSTGTTLIGDVIESQFKTAYNPNLGAAMSLVLMILIFICVSIMNRFGETDEEEVMAKV